MFTVLEHLPLEEKVQVIAAISNMMVESCPPTTEDILRKQQTLPENLQQLFLDAFGEYLLA